MLETENNIWYFGTDFFFFCKIRGGPLLDPPLVLCLVRARKEMESAVSLVPTGDITILMLSAVICLLGFNLSGSN